MTETAHMTAAEFEAIGRVLYGDVWRAKIANAMGVGLRNVQFWVAEPPANCKPIPPGVAADMLRLLNMGLADPNERPWIMKNVERYAEIARFLERATGAETDDQH